jgi:hypothetical protein
MSVIRRDFGQPPALKDVLPRAKEFTDAAMDIDIGEVLREARTVRSIGHAAAKMSGVRLQLEGDGTSKRIISAAYQSLYDVMLPSLADLGADRTQELFRSDTTHATLTNLSSTMDSLEFSRLTYRYRQRGEHLEVTDAGLVVQPGFALSAAMEAKRGGCPYAKGGGSFYFNRFTDHIVETYAEAHRQNLPQGWLGAIARSLSIS